MPPDAQSLAKDTCKNNTSRYRIELSQALQKKSKKDGSKVGACV